MGDGVRLLGAACLLLAACFGFSKCNDQHDRRLWFDACIKQRRGYEECRRTEDMEHAEDGR